MTVSELISTMNRPTMDSLKSISVDSFYGYAPTSRYDVDKTTLTISGHTCAIRSLLEDYGHIQVHMWDLDDRGKLFIQVEL